tara:strand:+ start:375 stop:1034 length:660 start_codon:yes stop_codon:yes gene_type:complete
MTKQTILVLCAHSDDQIFGPGATLAKYAKQGKRIITVIFSYGEFSMPHIKKEIAIKTRVDEAKKADKIIGGSGVFFLGLDELNLTKDAYSKNIPKKLIEFIKKYKPGKIFTHSFDDPHPNHREVYKLVDQVLDRINYQEELYTFDVWNPFNFRKRHYPKLYVDVTKTFKTKLRAVGCFESQLSLTTFFNYFPLIMMYIKALINGFRIDGKYAERFLKIK